MQKLLRARYGSLVWCGLLGNAVLASSSLAGGLLLPGSGPASTAQAGAFVATADDASALFVNPAGLTKTKGTQVVLGGVFVSYAMDFTRSGSYEKQDGVTQPWDGQPYGTVSDSSSPKYGVGSFQAVPTFSVVTDFGLPQWRFAIGVTAPTAYPDRNMEGDYVIDDPSRPPPPNRYDVLTQTAAVILPSVGVAYALNDQLSVGARFSWGIGQFAQKVHVWGQPNPNYAEWIGNEAVIETDVKDNFVPVVGLGVHYKTSPNIEIGAAFQTTTNIDAQGTTAPTVSKDLKVGSTSPTIDPTDDGTCAPGGVAGALKTCVQLSLPFTATVGARYKFLNGAEQEFASIEANLQWENWSESSDFIVKVDGTTLGLPLEEVIVRHGFDDTISARLGGNYRKNFGSSQGIVRAGVAYDTAAAASAYERLDLDGAAKTTMTAGVGLSFGKYAIELGAGYIYQGKRNVGEECNPTAAAPSCGDPASPENRTQPDPLAPILSEQSQYQSPFNTGTYDSSYLLFTLGLRASF